MRGRVLLAALVAAVALVLAGRAAAFNPALLEPRNGSVTFVDRSGEPMGTVLSASQSRSAAVPIDRISPDFLHAVVDAEDRRFYTHGAVDVLALARAAAAAVACGCNAGGASTITMQLARALFDIPSTPAGKIVQIVQAERIEAAASKRAILQAYANRVAMGENLYGVEAAARDYFGIPASDLDLAQSAFLAGLPNDPTQLDPRAHWAAARNRQRDVLRRMVEAGTIAGAQARIAAAEELHLRPPGGSLTDAQQLLFELAARAPATQHRIQTTIDLPLQRFVAAQARDVIAALSGRNVTQAAALVVDNRTGNVLAYLGSLDYFDDAYRGRNDGVQALRQPGSALKPFLYEFALDRQIVDARTVLADVPTSYAVPSGELYSPEDYSRRYAGPVTVRAALANSLNVPAVRVLSAVGVDPFLQRLRDLGFARLRRSPEYYGLGLTLGAGEVTLWDLAHAYVTLARYGDAIPLRAMDGPAPRGRQVGRRESWAYVADVLSDRYARAPEFGLGSVLDMPFPAFVKTGTSSGYRDTWTVGGTPEYTVAVWAGNFRGEPMRRVAGVSGAGPLWNRILLHLYDRRDPPRFARLPPPLAPALLRRPATAALDEWRAQQGATTGPLRILFPHDGDVFADMLSAHDPHRAEQQIAFRISRPPAARVAWTLDGKPLQRSLTDAYFWTVRPGEHVLRVSWMHASRTVHFRVARRLPHGPRGFTVISAR